MEVNLKITKMITNRAEEITFFMYIAAFWIWAQKTTYLNVNSAESSVPTLVFTLVSYSVNSGRYWKYLLHCL